MKPRCSWIGYLKVSLVTIPVRVYTAISSTEKITFNQLHKSCHQRIRQKLLCPTHGEVTREDVIKGYEYETDKFIVLNETELQAIRLETTGTIELVQFVRAEELDPLFLDAPYYIGPGRIWCPATSSAARQTHRHWPSRPRRQGKAGGP